MQLLREQPGIEALTVHLALVTLAPWPVDAVAVHEYGANAVLERRTTFGNPEVTPDTVPLASREEPLALAGRKAPAAGYTGVHAPSGGKWTLAWAFRPAAHRMHLLSVLGSDPEPVDGILARMQHVVPVLDLMSMHGTGRDGKEKPASPRRILTSRQETILRLMSDGLTDRQIASRLAFSEGTVGLEAGRIYAVLRVSGRVDAVAAGIAAGIIPSG